MLTHKHNLAECVGQWAWDSRSFDVDCLLQDKEFKGKVDLMVRDTLRFQEDREVTTRDKNDFKDLLWVDWWHTGRSRDGDRRTQTNLLRQVRRFGEWPGPAWWYIHPVAFVPSQGETGGDEAAEVEHANNNAHTGAVIQQLFNTCIFKWSKPGRVKVVFLNGLNPLVTIYGLNHQFKPQVYTILWRSRDQCATGRKHAAALEPRGRPARCQSTPGQTAASHLAHTRA